MCRVGVIITICLIFTCGCQTKNSVISIDSADKIVILYGVSSHATVLTDEKDILNILDIYNNLSLDFVNETMELEKQHSLIYYKGDESIAKFNIDKNGFIRINDKVYKDKKDSSLYSTIHEMYNQR